MSPSRTIIAASLPTALPITKTAGSLSRSCSDSQLFSALRKSTFRPAGRDLAERRAAGADVPPDYLRHHFAAALVATIQWWIGGGVEQTPEVVADYFAPS